MNYLDCISANYPTVMVDCYGDTFNYNDLNWLGGDPLPLQADLDAIIFMQLVNDKLSELSAACQADIMAGFVSSALGSPNMYDSTEVDQLNLIGAVSATAPTPSAPSGYSNVYAVRPVVNGVIQPKTYIVHSYGQFRQVLADGSAYKSTKLLAFNTKRNYLLTLTTVADVDAVTWLSTP
jgi:hypothetical protein